MHVDTAHAKFNAAQHVKYIWACGGGKVIPKKPQDHDRGDAVCHTVHQVSDIEKLGTQKTSKDEK
jgi:hypothetical protein